MRKQRLLMHDGFEQCCTSHLYDLSDCYNAQSFYRDLRANIAPGTSALLVVPKNYTASKNLKSISGFWRCLWTKVNGGLFAKKISHTTRGSEIWQVIRFES